MAPHLMVCFRGFLFQRILSCFFNNNHSCVLKTVGLAVKTEQVLKGLLDLEGARFAYLLYYVIMVSHACA